MEMLAANMIRYRFTALSPFSSRPAAAVKSRSLKNATAKQAAGRIKSIPNSCGSDA